MTSISGLNQFHRRGGEGQTWPLTAHFVSNLSFTSCSAYNHGKGRHEEGNKIQPLSFRWVSPATVRHLSAAPVQLGTSIGYSWIIHHLHVAWRAARGQFGSLVRRYVGMWKINGKHHSSILYSCCPYIPPRTSQCTVCFVQVWRGSSNISHQGPRHLGHLK